MNMGLYKILATNLRNYKIPSNIIDSQINRFKHLDFREVEFNVRIFNSPLAVI